MRFIIPCKHCGKENIVPLLSTTNICVKCAKGFRIQLPKGLTIAQRIFDYLRITPKGEARIKEMQKELKLSRVELNRGLNYLEDNGVVERIIIEHMPKGYRFSRRYLSGHKTSKTTNTDEIRTDDGHPPGYAERVKVIQKELLEKYPLVINSYQHPMPIVFDWAWTENEGDMTKPHTVHKTTRHPSVPDELSMLQSNTE